MHEHCHSHGLVGRSTVRQRAGVKAVSISLGVLGLAAAAQTAFFVLSGSVALLADLMTLAKFWGPLIGSAVAMISLVCSIGNVPLAAVLWNGGISFGGVLAFVFADLRWLAQSLQMKQVTWVSPDLTTTSIPGGLEPTSP